MWSEFHPDEAFNERWRSTYGEDKRKCRESTGRAGFVRFLAARDRVPVHSLDPTRAAEVDDSCKKFSPEEVKLFFILRTVSEYGREYQGTTKTVDEELAGRHQLSHSIAEVRFCNVD
jgi:hypothetical protein